MTRKIVKEIVPLLAVLLLIFFISSCSQNNYVKRDRSFTPEGWNRIVIFPFSGSRGYTYLAAEAFSFHLKSKKHFQIVEPKTSYALMEKMKVPATDNVTFIEYAIKVAHQLDAQAMIMGNIETVTKDSSYDAIATVRLIDVKSGRVVAESHRPSGLKVKNSEEQCVIISVSNVSIDINEVLAELAGQKKTDNDQKKAGENRQGSEKKNTRN